MTRRETLGLASGSAMGVLALGLLAGCTAPQPVASVTSEVTTTTTAPPPVIAAPAPLPADSYVRTTRRVTRNGTVVSEDTTETAPSPAALPPTMPPMSAGSTETTETIAPR